MTEKRYYKQEVTHPVNCPFRDELKSSISGKTETTICHRVSKLGIFLFCNHEYDFPKDCPLCREESE